eukprot:jgi/Ulvmu1/493/UM001_0501.1
MTRLTRHLCPHGVARTAPQARRGAMRATRRGVLQLGIPASVALQQSAEARPVSVKAEASSNGSEAPSMAPVILWFKHDLRTRDHPGLAKALAGKRPVIAFFCFDPATLSDQATTLWGPQAVHGAVANLKESLTDLGIPMVIRTGNTVSNLLQLVEDTAAGTVSCESEIEYRWLSVQESVENGLPASASIKLWRAPIWEPTAYATNYNTFRSRRSSALKPLAAAGPCEDCTSLPASVDPGDVPAAADWHADLRAAATQRFADETPIDAIPVSEPDTRLRQEKGRLWQELQDLLEGGEAAFVAMLGAYLRGEPLPRSAPQHELSVRMLKTAGQLEQIPGNTSGSFTAIFQVALALGMLSRRQVYEAADAYQRERNGGMRLALGFPVPAVVAAKSVAECGDYHEALGHLLLGRPTQAPGAARKFWRWNGQLVDFLVAGPPGGIREDTPALLLVHGFGAFAEHWRRNLPELAAKGYAVYACTLPGFGPSEKSPQNYTTDLWKAYVRDFMVHVVRRPAIVAGNSIGGVIPANACADHPHVFRGIVLVNTAGSTESEWDPENIPDKKPQQQIIVNVLGWTTFQYLQRGIRKQLEKLYPTRPFNADDFLNDEIYRASCDPCSLQVLKSGFYLAPPRPLPYMLNTLYRGPVLVVQGVLDILNDARGRAAKLEAAIPAARLVTLDAGHCPHDEVPELVNAAIADFAAEVYGGAPAVAAAQADEGTPVTA